MVISDFNSTPVADLTSARTSSSFDLSSQFYTDKLECPVTKYEFNKATTPAGEVVTALNWLKVDPTTGVVTINGYAGAEIGTWNLYFKVSNQFVSYTD